MKQYIKIHTKDNNVTIVDSEGVNYDEYLEKTQIKVKKHLFYSDKVAIERISKDCPIIRYGEIIGYALEDISEGEIINDKNIYIKKADTLNLERPYINKEKAENKIKIKKTFLGYENNDGTVGTRNILAVCTTVQCCEGFVKLYVERIKKELLPLYENVDDVIAINHSYGCGVAINGKDSEIPIRTIKNLRQNPNFGGQYINISLGCEKLTPSMIGIKDEDNLIIQQDADFDESMMKAMELAKNKLEILNKRQRKEVPISKLRIGVQCGGSDALSGFTSNRLIGKVVDILVYNGATVIFSEVTEIRDAADVLLSRIKDQDVRKKFLDEIKWYDNYLLNGNVDRSANPSPGNKKGGLSSIIDKSMGSVIKSGSMNIDDVLSPGELIRKDGLVFAATPASDFVCGTQQVSSGINLMLFSTGRGTTYNLNMLPVIKISSNSILFNKWRQLIDFDAGRILSNDEDMDDLAHELIDLMIDIASNTKHTKADGLGLYNQIVVFNPAPIT